MLDTDLADLVGEEVAEGIIPIVPLEQVCQDALEAWQLEVAKVDRSVRLESEDSWTRSQRGVLQLQPPVPKKYGKAWS